MLEYLRQLLRNDLANLDGVSATTGIDQDSLRRFANGFTVPDAIELEQLASHFQLELTPKSGAQLLPLERDASRGIRKFYKDQFAAAAEALRLALTVIGSKKDGSGSIGHATKQRGAPIGVLTLCLGIHVKTIKHLRTLIAAAELGLAEDANVSARAMFEANLALQFILRPRVPLIENGKRITGIKGKYEKKCPNCKHVLDVGKPPVPLRRLDTVMRAKLYVARDSILRDQKLKEWKSLNIPIPPEVAAVEANIEKVAEIAKSRIGPGWVARQAEKKSFSGLSVRDLAASYKLLDYYSVVYYRQSNIVHGANATDYVDFDADGLKLNLGPNPRDIDVVLFTATAIMNFSSDLMNRRFGLGFDKQLKDALKRTRKNQKQLLASPEPD